MVESLKVRNRPSSYLQLPGEMEGPMSSSCWRHSACGEGASSVLSHERHYAQLLGGIILPVRETSGLALGNKIILRHSREAPCPALREREGSAFCPPVTSCSPVRMLYVQPRPSPPDGRMGQTSSRKEQTQAERTNITTDFCYKIIKYSTDLKA